MKLKFHSVQLQLEFIEYLCIYFFLNFVGNTRKHDQLENALKRY